MGKSDRHAPAAGSGTVLAIIVASYLMIVVDISIVITGLPRIQAELGFSAARLSWVSNAYTLAFGGLLLLGARAGDILGRRRMFIGGLSLFTLASVAIGLSPSAAWLLAARAVQGAGAAVLAPSTLALLSTHFAEGPARTRALSLYAAAAGIGATLGLVLGGLFADLLSWRAGFFVNLPIGLALVAAARKHVAETPVQAGRFDLAGAASATLGMTSLVYGLVRAAEAGWQEPAALAALAGGALMLAAFVAIERRVGQPVLPLRLLAHRERAGAYAARMLFMAGAVGFWFFSTQFLQGVLQLRPLQAGLAFLPVTLPNFASAMAVPRLARRHGGGSLLLAGLLLGAIGLLWLGQADTHASYWLDVAPPMALIGLGQGLLLGPLTAAGVAGVAPRDAGAASGLVNVAHQLGGALGLGVLVLIAAAAAPATAPGIDALAHRVSAVMDAGALLLALALLVAWACIVRPRRRPAHRQETLA
ncbi:MFS transporter [Roseateles saccharophilus]|uniref:EmrB/QacA subfamily drug resistance transporter n=1 Tax=Roseateles saccharophilus TaxID=304 RepID=A0A4R3UIY1_ROSSA|nr:MFS transporter [Roseateles saccharophilus]MDG0834714.1 MFS transporter [Roseateles saccharophilus]TCU88974.1 EmrB/QacA subfamily drug resistance transporter [Roseateles saccharophilus]